MDRAVLILELNKNNPSKAASFLKCGRSKAYRWYYRAKKLIKRFKREPTITDSELERLLRSFLKDNERSGSSLIYTPE